MAEERLKAKRWSDGGTVLKASDAWVGAVFDAKPGAGHGFSIGLEWSVGEKFYAPSVILDDNEAEAFANFILQRVKRAREHLATGQSDAAPLWRRDY